ncbi:PREDICTED: uncharacterized protein LOC104599535 [Nelumbo nucifera]|uniref:Uncharacterized protein LOC104599535 n=2 Tax=Nelumbo nucifera TaxID=4432 RepID=A0A1U8A2F7_NELNU|nr:PREDICTED: uncharacterized protein LOC104599535 [Nelumbo nucifera]DAD22713.1 TPA_asm: hypothetical protein HUJ06_024176 [Nelumbo nucifera]
MKALLILFITVGWICLATQRVDARTTEAQEEVTSSKLLAVAEHKKNSYQLPLDSLKYEVKLGRKVEVGRTTGAKNVKINNLTGKNKRDPAVGSAALDSNEATNKMGNGIMSYDDDNESFGSYGHPSGSFTNTHHVYPDYKRPPH